MTTVNPELGDRVKLTPVGWDYVNVNALERCKPLPDEVYGTVVELTFYARVKFDPDIAYLDTDDDYLASTWLMQMDEIEVVLG